MCIREKMHKLDYFTERILVFVSKEQKEKIRQIAEKNFISMSDVVRMANDEYLKNHVIDKK